jgi:predicted O-methyltransferase YrrM
MNFDFSIPIPNGSDLTLREFRLLAELMVNNKLDKYLEVGVWHGINLLKLANLCEVNNHQCKIVGYDCFDDDPMDDNSHTSGWPSKELVERNVSPYSDTVSLVQGFAKDVVEKLDGEKFPLIFHDANHAYQAVYDDLLLLKQLSLPSTVIVAHNSEADDARLNYGAKSAIDQLVKENHFKILTRVDRSTAIIPC